MKGNPRITKKEQGLLKGAIRRVFARSDLRKLVLDAAKITHSDPKRPRVTAWVTCAVCGKPAARYECAVDHLEPVVDLNSSFEEQGADLTIDRTWCVIQNLQVIDPVCHNIKTKQESALRKYNKKAKKESKK